MMKFDDPVRMQVYDPTYGKLEVRAYCRVDAKLQAAAEWGVDFTDLARAKVAVETAALDKKREMEAAE